MISRGFVYEVRIHKHVSYHVIWFMKKSCLENKRPKSTDRREPLAGGVDVKKSTRELSRELSTEQNKPKS